MWTFERDAACDDDIARVQVPVGATVVISPYLLHRSPEFWPNPEGFSPKRFLDGSGPHRYAYLPFGGGRRICIGAGFAMLEAAPAVATISRTHRLDLTPGINVAPRAEITLRPAGPGTHAGVVTEMMLRTEGPNDSLPEASTTKGYDARRVGGLALEGVCLWLGLDHRSSAKSARQGLRQGLPYEMRFHYADRNS